MRYGHVRDNFPRVMLTLPGHSQAVSVEFIVDTGFDGELALPTFLVSQLAMSPPYRRRVRLADGTERDSAYYKITIEWNEEQRLTEVLVLEGNPLLGCELLFGSLLQVEMTDGGEVSIEPL